MNHNKELSQLSIDPKGNLVVDTPKGEHIIVGFTSNIFGNAFLVIKKEAPEPGKNTTNF